MPRSTDYDLRYITERRNRDGSTRRYWQVSGQKPVRLPDDLDWAKVATQYNRRRDATRNETVVVDGTVAWVIGKYRETNRFKKLSESSTRVYDRWLSELEKLWGPLPLSAITRKVAVDFIEIYKDQPATQGHVQAVLYLVLEQAKYHGLITTENPAAKLNLSSPKARDAAIHSVLTAS